jgi:hypothetical protein
MTIELSTEEFKKELESCKTARFDTNDIFNTVTKIIVLVIPESMQL